MNYFYRPILDGRTYKCAGIATDKNRQWFWTTEPNAFEVRGYHGDQISAELVTLLAMHA